MRERSGCGDIGQFVLRSLPFALGLPENRFPVGTFANTLERIDKPRIHGRNLFESHDKKATTSIGIGQGTVSTAAFDVQHLHKRIEAVVRRILVSNARERQRIPERMVLVVNPHLLEGILEEA